MITAKDIQGEMPSFDSEVLVVSKKEIQNIWYGYAGIKPTLDDRFYFISSLDDVRKYMFWFKVFINGTQFRDELFDCDNFTSLYVSLYHLYCHKNVKAKAQGSAIKIKVKMEQPFAGVPAGGNHACVGHVVNYKGKPLPLVVEPQSCEAAPFDKYPNPQNVYFLDG